MSHTKTGTATPPSGADISSCGPSEDGDPFRVLGLSPGATAAEVKHAYRTLSARYHPDAAAAKADGGLVGPCTAQEAAEQFLAVQRAYETLTDRHSRALFEARAARSLCHDDTTREARFHTAHSPHHRRDALRKVYWGVSLCLGIVIVSLTLAPLERFRERRGDALGHAHSPVAPFPDANRRGNQTAGRSAPPAPDSPVAVLPRDSATPPPKGMPHPAVPAAFMERSAARPLSPAEPSTVEPPVGLHPDGGRPEPEPTGLPMLAPAEPAPRRGEPVNGEAVQPPADRNPRWLGSWTATCLLPQPGQFFVGELELAGEARFRWRQVRTAGTRTGGGAPDDQSRLVLHLEPDAAASSRLALRDGIGEHSKPAAMLELASSSHAKLSFPDASTHMPAGCLRWELYRKPTSAPLEGLWVLTADASPSSARIAPAYLQLRIERRGPVLEAAFQGQYTVPVASIAPSVQFRFQLPVSDSLESIPWQDDTGSRGVVSLVPVAASRLAVHWVRLTPSQGRPQLSSGVSILRRME